MITLCIKAHCIMQPQDTHERRIFRLELFNYLDCSLSSSGHAIKFFHNKLFSDFMFCGKII